MNKPRLSLIIAALFGLAGTAALLLWLFPSRPAQVQDAGTPERIGVYDSRAIAVAYVGSVFQKEKMKSLTQQLASAKREEDQEAVARLETEGRAWQATLMNQGFGTAPVDAILAHIEGDLPGIRETAGVTNLVSKWNQAELDRHPKVVQVDVTMRLVDAFHPNETQRQRAIEIQTKKPQEVKE